MRQRLFFGLVFLAALSVLLPRNAWAVPAFARQLNASCSMCHWAYPELNEFGEEFAGNGYRMPGGSEIPNQIETGDSELSLIESLPLAIRMQADLRYRPRVLTDRDREFLRDAARRSDLPRGVDFQTPWGVKLISGGPISRYLNYYVYFFLSEYGGTGPVEDAWINAQNFGIDGLGVMVGQYQLSDFMFPRELRLTRQDYLIYTVPLSDTNFRLTYQRGANVTYGLEPFDLVIGAANGNGIGEAEASDGQYLGRRDPVFNNDDNWITYGRLGAGYGPLSVGVFGLYGSELAPDGDTGLFGPRATELGAPAGQNFMWRAGPDFKATLGDFRVWGQWLWGEDSNPAFVSVDTEDREGTLQGGFVAASWVASSRWVFTGLFNRIIASRHEIDAHVYTANASWYWRRNFKLGLEANYDAMHLRATHPYKEHSVIAFIDTAF